MWPFSWIKKSNRPMGIVAPESAHDTPTAQEHLDKCSFPLDFAAADPAAGRILTAICDQPDDDVPRLEFANWLEMNGQVEWAEFIRTQIARVRAPEDSRVGEQACDPYLQKLAWEFRLTDKW